MGAQVVLTEQAELVALLRQNLKANFEDDSAIAAAVFFCDVFFVVTFFYLCLCFSCCSCKDSVTCTHSESSLTHTG
jgi:hypothetical protein